jgi:epoxyqueuosine reductase
MATSISEPRTKAAIRERATALGFDAVGFARAVLSEAAGADLMAFLGQGLHGTMDWLARRAAERADPRALWSEARSVVMVGANYGPAEDPLAATRRSRHGAVSVYAQGRDYHDVLKGRLKDLAGWLVAPGGAVKVFVDTAPVMEKPLAEAAGLGWQGKHTNLVSRRYGSWLFLGALFTSLELEPDVPETDHCGTCRACLDACPTGAFLDERRIDARRCVSYLTIEHKGTIDRALRPLMGNRVYGCDDCLAVCPWNKYATPSGEPAFRPRPGSTDLADLAELDDAAFRARFAGSPVKRTGRDRFVRNVLIAIGNSGEAGLAGAAEARLDDASPIVRAMAVWALGRLVPERARHLARTRAADETDTEARVEWDHIPISPSAMPK